MVLVGDGPLKEALIRSTEDLRINKKVIFTGYLEYQDIREIYALASCFILPSMTEQWGLVVNEALASGLPVLSSYRVGSAPNLIKNNKVGYTFDPLSTHDLVRKMHKIVEDMKSIDFKKNTFNVMSAWGKEKYSDNIYQACTKAIQSRKDRKWLSILFLRLYIKFLK